MTSLTPLLGTYHALKEQLKRAAIQVVREKFLHTNISDPVEKSKVMATLYTYLVQQMHSW